jgi:hypothetical protein
MISPEGRSKEFAMLRRLSLLLFALALTVISLGGLSTPQAQASTCTRQCVLVSCGLERCTLTDCSTVYIHVVCGN